MIKNSVKTIGLIILIISLGLLLNGCGPGGSSTKDNNSSQKNSNSFQVSSSVRNGGGIEKQFPARVIINSDKKKIVYYKSDEWQEIAIKKSLSINAILGKINIDIFVKNSNQSKGIRILFDGVGGDSHKNYWFFIFSPKEGDNTITLSAGDFTLGNGKFQWDNITNIQIGGFGGYPLSYIINNIEIINYTVRK